MEIGFTVVCVPEGSNERPPPPASRRSGPLRCHQEAANNTSLGVGALGSISVPLSSSEGSAGEVGSETIPGQFYDRYFALMQRLLLTSREGR